MKTEIKDVDGERLAGQPIGPEQLLEFTRVLERYSAGRKKTADRILASENWWKLRNTQEAQKETELGKDGSFTSKSGWLHNVITSKHADAMDAYPQAVLLPREAQDQQEAQALSAILPCVMEENDFEETYSKAMWQKTKFGTGAYKVVWDAGKLGGLGDIAISCVNLLNLYWQPEIQDIQKSRYFFHTELLDRDVLKAQYPQTANLKASAFMSARFLGDEQDSSDRITVVEVYYHKIVDGRNTLQYCKYAGDQVLFATENETEPEYDAQGQVIREPLAVTGLYDHGRYPFVFDALFPVEGSPCGYGYVDICRNPQITIDLLKTSFVKNAKVGATPRYFSRMDGNVQEGEFLDLSKPFVHVSGNLDEASLRPVDYNPLSQVYVNVLNDTVQELRETSGNTEASTGNIASGVTAASAIAALQEASGKGSRDSNRTSYRAFSQVTSLCIELIRQFYDTPRTFRIMGADGGYQFSVYSNQGIKPQHQGDVFGQDMGYRLPVFDIRIMAQKKSAYSTMAQNELALQFYQMGFFNPQMAPQAMKCLKMMDFDGKDALIQDIAQGAQLHEKLEKYMQMSLDMAQELSPQLVPEIAQDMMQTLGAEIPGGSTSLAKLHSNRERADVERTRQRTAEAAQP